MNPSKTPRSTATADPAIDVISRAVAAYFSDVTGRTEPEAGDLDLAFSIRQALTDAGHDDLRALAGLLNEKAILHDSVADRWSKDDREQALIDSGIAAGYRGGAELALKHLGSRTTGREAVLALHTPIRRYLPKTGSDDSYPTAEAALAEHLKDSMRGFESLPRDRPEQMPFFEICAECSRVENAAHDDGHPGDDDGSELIVVASRWPCATYTALNAADAR